MELIISTKISFKDEQSDFRSSENQNDFILTYDADSNEVITTTGQVSKDFKISNVNKYVYDLKPGNTFDVLLQADILKADSIDNIASVHIFCYESTSINPFKLPIKFALTLEDFNTQLGLMSEFSIGNVNQLSSDIRINGIVVPTDSRATLVIIASTKD